MRITHETWEDHARCYTQSPSTGLLHTSLPPALWEMTCTVHFSTFTSLSPWSRAGCLWEVLSLLGQDNDECPPQSSAPESPALIFTFNTRSDANERPWAHEEPKKQACRLLLGPGLRYLSSVLGSRTESSKSLGQQSGRMRKRPRVLRISFSGPCACLLG